MTRPAPWLVRLATAAGGVAAGSAALAGVGVLPGGLALGVAGSALAAVAGGVGLASARPDLHGYGRALCRASHPGRLALTVDDGPDPRSTPALLDALVRAGASATFFVLADRVRADPGLLRALVDAGMEVGVHGREHSARLTWAPPTAGARWLAEARATLEAAGAPPTRWFRPPFGAVSPRVFAAAAGAGLEVVWCSVRTGDGGPASPDRIRARCRSAVATDIVLLHDGPGHARALLPELLDEWAGRGIAAASLTRALEPA